MQQKKYCQMQKLMIQSKKIEQSVAQQGVAQNKNFTEGYKS
jgi:hypothetical protein